MAMRRDRLRSRWLAFAPPILLLTIVLAFPALLRFGGPWVSDPYFREMLTQQGVFGTPYYLASSVLLTVSAILVLMRITVWQRLLATGFLCSVALVVLLLPALGELQQGPVKEAAAIAKATGEPVHAWEINMPSFSVYLGGIPVREGLPNAGELVFTRVDALAQLGLVEVVYRKGGIALVRRLSPE
jgi:hypothetical protein